MPRMMSNEIEAIDALLDERRPARCLEWGCGGSTVYYPNRHPSIKLWISIEHDAGWYERVKPMITPNVDLRLRRVDAEHMQEGFYDWDHYVNAGIHDAPFDFVLVDGRVRIQCLEVARRMLSAGGIVALHDADRPAYRRGMRHYARSKRITRGRLTGNVSTHQGLTLLWMEE